MKFSEVVKYGNPKSQSRAVTLGDFNRDKKLDWAIGNIGQSNRLFLGDGSGGVLREHNFGQNSDRMYCLASIDIDLDGDNDLIAGNVGQQNSIFFNNGDATGFREEKFGSETNATYGLALGDLNGEGLPDIAVANSDAKNHVFLNRMKRVPKVPAVSGSSDSANQKPKKTLNIELDSLAKFQKRAEYQTNDWPAFRGLGGRGIAEGFSLPTT